ncbi:MAG: efflux RND transporter periplasmic adaptor subunit [Gammaproteobacteria bacterium]|nr:efflux RND transporter periplasmic adaptor subunit [Gammaproteobacteria bacterium]
MSNKNLIALVFAIGMVIWLFSGTLASNKLTADENTVHVADSSEIPLVRGMKSTAARRQIYLDVRGQTRANRLVQVKSEITGIVEQVPGEKGKRVKAGDLLCQVAIDSRRSDLTEAIANLKSAQLEYDGVQDLNQRGLQSEIILAKAKATLEKSRSRAKRAELALQKTRIVAPFDGIVETQPVEVGHLLTTGAICVTLIEIDPILVSGQVAERNIGDIHLGDEVHVELITGKNYVGLVTFSGRSPDATTRTFPIEVTIENPGDSIRAGLTSTMRVPVGVEIAHLISPASLVLDDEGIVGVRIVDDENIVRFKPVQVVSESADGVWVTGLPNQINLITVGQEEVFEGQVVKIDFTPLTALVGS